MILAKIINKKTPPIEIVHCFYRSTTKNFGLTDSADILYLD